MRLGFAGALTGCALAVSIAAATPGFAQSAAPKTTTKKAAPAPDKPTSGAPASEAGLKARVEQLEEQLVDIQVTIGTLESLARTSGTGSPVATARPAVFSGGGDAAVASRVDGLEIQLRALVAQVEQLTDQVRALGGRRSAAPDQTETRIAAAPPLRTTTMPDQRAASGGFGTTVVTPAGTPQPADPIGGLISSDQLPPPTPASVPAGDGNPKQIYETAYGYLLQQNYGAAETAFEEFLGRFPGDALAGNAQYWLGETYFVRGQYKQAAGAFLKGYQTYARSAKAPDSLLKLAMSLDRLGQKDAACTSYNELTTRFPTAPQTVRGRADSERRRIGCP